MQDTEEDCPTTTVLIHLPGLFADTPDGIPELTRSAPVEVWIGSAQYGHSLRPIDTTINRSYVPTSIVSMSNAEAITAQLSTVSLVADEPRAMHEAAGDEGAIGREEVAVLKSQAWNRRRRVREDPGSHARSIFGSD